MRRFLTPTILVFSLAIAGSLSVHVPIYAGLGVLADNLPERAIALPTAEVEFIVSDESSGAAKPDSPTPPEEAKDEPLPPDETPPPETPVPKKPKVAQKPPEPPKPPPKPSEPPKPPPTPPKVATPTPPPEQKKQMAVRVEANDPLEEAPENARFLAETNQRAEEEMVARESVSTPQSAQSPETSETAALDPATQEDEAPQPERAPQPEQPPSRQPRPQPTSGPRTPERVAEASPSPPDASAPGRRGDAQPTTAGADEAMETIVVNDGLGSFTVQVPRRRRAQAGGEGGEGRARPTTPNLRINYRTFAEATGVTGGPSPDEYQPTQQRRRGPSRHTKNFGAFRRALEDNVPNVKFGNQTALNTRASPFAKFIVDTHDRIHESYVGGFLSTLPSLTDPIADPNLMARVEIRVKPDGTLGPIAFVKSSGNTQFDLGVFLSVMRAAPFPKPPEAIHSADGYTYMHWEFHRGPQQCARWNTRPFILPDVPGADSAGSGSSGSPVDTVLGAPGARPTMKASPQGPDTVSAPMPGAKVGEAQGSEPQGSEPQGSEPQGEGAPQPAPQAPESRPSPASDVPPGPGPLRGGRGEVPA